MIRTESRTEAARAMPRILMVDDDALVLTLVSEGLRSEGFEVMAAASAEEALTLIEESRPDLALIDMRLPETSGIDLAKTLRDRYVIPFLVLSGYVDTEVVDQAVAAGALTYLVKPIDISQIVPAVRSARRRAAG